MPWKWPKGRPFVKGQRPKNWRPVGSERETDEGIMVKINESNKWRGKHLVVWEAAHGPLPKGARVSFRDGDKFNCTLDNLRLALCSQNVSQKIGDDGSLYVKKSGSDRWRRKQLVVWEGAHGPLPAGQTVIFADGNPQNCDLDNLVPVPLNWKQGGIINMDGKELLYRFMGVEAGRNPCDGLREALAGSLAKILEFLIEGRQEDK